MAIRSTRSINITLQGDVEMADSFEASVNSGSPGVIEYKSFPVGFTAITAPAGSYQAVTIVPPSDNTNAITLKGVTGDTGIVLKPNEPVSIPVTGAFSMGLTVATGATLIRLIWT